MRNRAILRLYFKMFNIGYYHEDEENTTLQMLKLKVALRDLGRAFKKSLPALLLNTIRR